MNRIAQAPPVTTPDSTQADEALRRVIAGRTPARTAPAAPARPSDWYTTAAWAEHRKHCTPCREVGEASDAAAAENGASMQRRDRRQLGLSIVKGGSR